MHIDKARQLKIGQRVKCPPDRGDPGYWGTVCEQADLAKAQSQKNTRGTEFIWVLITNTTTGRRAMWPSNRIG